MMKNLLLLAALAATTSAKECDYFAKNTEDSHCLKAPLTVNTTVPLTPLFPTPPTFVYGVAELSEADIQTIREKDQRTILTVYDGPVLFAAWWLAGYDNSTLNFNRSQSRNYYVLSLETNNTNPIGGDAGGCTSLLGSECVRNLKAYFAGLAFDADVVAWGMGYVFNHNYRQIKGRPDARSMSCPEDLFISENPVENAHDPLRLSEDGNFAAIRSRGFSMPPPPPGNASFTHASPAFRYRSMEEHKKRGLVAITVSWPIAESVNGQPLNYTVDDVTVETACLRLGAPAGSGGENGASSYRTSGGLVMVVIGAFWILFQA